MTGSTTQLVNGLFLLGTFAGARLIYGGYMVRVRSFSRARDAHAKSLNLQSYEFWQTLYEIRNDGSLVICLVYGVGNIVLNGLNWFW